MEKTINGVKFTNLVNNKEKERAIKSGYSPNEGKAYNLGASLDAGEAFFKRNRESIREAFRLLRESK